jgi:hypothetical protein
MFPHHYYWEPWRTGGLLPRTHRNLEFLLVIMSPRRQRCATYLQRVASLPALFVYLYFLAADDLFLPFPISLRLCSFGAPAVLVVRVLLANGVHWSWWRRGGLRIGALSFNNDIIPAGGVSNANANISIRENSPMTYSSLLLRPRFVRLIVFSVPSWATSSLLASIARRNCSSS